MDNGQWKIRNRERGIVNEEWRMGDEEWELRIEN